VFAQIKREGSRLTDLAKGANMTPQSMGELVTERVELGYVERRPDPTDGRAKLIVLIERGNACIDAGESTIHGLEKRITEVLGERGHRQLRILLAKLLAEA
jgi:DNA-binding MarR family transcriptional regulator